MDTKRRFFHGHNYIHTLQAPLINFSEQCGPGYAPAFIIDPTNIQDLTYNWWSAPTGGTLLQSSKSNTYTGFVSSTTSFWISSSSGLAESPRSIELQIIVHDPLAVTATVTDDDICQGTGVSLGYTQVPGAYAYDTFAWVASPETGSGMVGGSAFSSPFITPTLPGTYTYTLHASKAGVYEFPVGSAQFYPCNAYDSIEVSVAAAPQLTVDSVLPGCQGTDFTLHASSTDPFATFEWTGVPGAPLAGDTQVVGLSSNATATVTVTALNGCTTTGTVDITVYEAPPAPSVANGTDICGEAYSDMSVSSNSMLLVPIYRWYDDVTAGTLLQESTSNTYGGLITTSTTLYVSEFDEGSGCESVRAAISVAVVTGDDGEVVADNNPVPHDATLELTFNQLTFDFNFYNDYEWHTIAGDPGDSGLIGLGTGNPLIVGPRPGTYTYQVRATDLDKTCSIYRSITVTVL